MTSTAQIIVACGIAGMLLLRGLPAIIWSWRCDPTKPHYRVNWPVAELRLLDDIAAMAPNPPSKAPECKIEPRRDSLS